jgi:hypothetical protein
VLRDERLLRCLHRTRRDLDDQVADCHQCDRTPGDEPNPSQGWDRRNCEEPPSVQAIPHQIAQQSRYGLGHHCGGETGE